MVFLFLIVLWGVVLVPPYLKRREETRPGRYLSTFDPSSNGMRHERMPTGMGRPLVDPLAPRTRHHARQRRLNVLVGLGALCGVCVVAAVAFQGFFLIGVAVLSATLLGAYVAVLSRHAQLAAERSSKVRYLDQHRELDEYDVLDGVSG